MIRNSQNTPINARILLDGEKIANVVQCDPEEGWVEVIRYTLDGHVAIEGDEIARDRKTGKVEIVSDETIILRNLIKAYGGHSVSIVRDGAELPGWCLDRPSPIAIRDLVSLIAEE